MSLAIVLPNYLRPESLSRNLIRLGDLDIPILVSIDKYDGIDETKRSLNQRCYEIADNNPQAKVRKSDVNLGCKKGIETAVDWAADNFDHLIIIEDDLDFDLSAINFFQLLLEKFSQSDECFLSGNNFSEIGEIHWTSIMHIWGWACNARSWKKYRREFSLFHCDVRDARQLDNYKSKFSDRDTLLKYLSVIENFGSLAQKARDGEIDTWDYQLSYYIFVKQIKVIAPAEDLFSNIGFDAVATHTSVGSSPKPRFYTFKGFPEDVSVSCGTWSDTSLASLEGYTLCPVCKDEGSIFGAFEGGLDFPLIYRKCHSCGHLFVRNCSWIDAAYAEGVDEFDQGAVSRSIFSLPLAFALANLSPTAGVLDYGGGVGLLSRMLRDLGINAYSYDRYVQGTLNPGFHLRDLRDVTDNINMVIAIEVLEHIVEIGEFVGAMLRLSPKIILTCTSVNDGQDISWPYLDKNHCQHVSVYSRKSLEILAEKMGMKIRFCGPYQIFYSNEISLLDLKIAPLSELMGTYEKINYRNAALDNARVVKESSPPMYL